MREALHTRSQAALAGLALLLVSCAVRPDPLSAQAADRLRATGPGSPWAETGAREARSDPWRVFAASSVGSAAGFWLGFLAPRVVAPDDCQETCAGMWLTIPSGSILGAAVGGTLAGGRPRGAFLGSALGFGVGFAAASAADDDAVAMIVFSLAHGAVTALLSTR